MIIVLKSSLALSQQKCKRHGAVGRTFMPASGGDYEEEFSLGTCGRGANHDKPDKQRRVGKVICESFLMDSFPHNRQQCDFNKRTEQTTETQAHFVSLSWI